MNNCKIMEVKGSRGTAHDLTTRLVNGMHSSNVIQFLGSMSRVLYSQAPCPDSSYFPKPVNADNRDLARKR